MGWFSKNDEQKAAEDRLSAAKEKLARVTDRDRTASKDYLDANEAVVQAEKDKNLPWYLR